ncbi:cytochrome P450 [Pseudanabaena sp. FACHB-2040]|uniref:cytochrome P450 n=1 Tax=Pseudanabaena sp. FACHB-2040 TaxID=2692859 RepID=UPI0016836745|nr:cytochrome P450 [Pseudanabaena sp. FACHB-2040]MBD2259352.1 cytochrome P450 [Pseudanabaena sp. FACHB-2040]
MATAVQNQPTLTVPGPRPLPLVGRTLNSIRFAKDSVGYTRGLFQTYGNLVALAAGGGTRLYSPRDTCPATVFACGPKLVRQVTTQHEVYFKHPLTGPLYRLRDTSKRTKPLNHFLVGLFGVNADQHLQQRRLMLPAFHRQRLETYAQDMVAITEDQLKQLQLNQANEMAAWLRQLTLRIATKSLFGEDVGNQGESTGQIIQDALSQQGNLLMKVFPLDLPGLPWNRYLNLVARYEASMSHLIKAKQQSDEDASDVLSMLMQVQDEDSGAYLSEEELLGHVGVLFVAGHETSANALTWTLFLLSQHPQIMADLLDELDAVLHGEPPTIEQLSQLPLLENVIKESMRILPPVPWNGRVTAKPTELGGYELPTGTEVLVSIYQTHQMPDLYPDPASFNPRRWETIHPDAYEYNPFSAGPRLCIGAGFAMMEIKIVLAMLLQRYRLQFVPQKPIDRSGVIVLTPRHGLSLVVHRQDRQFHQGVGDVQGNVHEMVKLT